MAANPLIALQTKVPDIGQTFSNALLNIGRFDAIREGREQAPVRQRLLEAQTATSEAQVPSQEAIDNARQGEIVKSLGLAAQQIIPDLERGNIDLVINNLEARRANLIEQQKTNPSITTVETDEAIRLARTNPQELLTRSQQAVQLASQIASSTKGIQFGGQQTFKDAQGNLFFGTTKRDPQTGGVQSVLAPVSGGVEAPVGQVSLVSPLGQTAEEKLETDVTRESQKEEVKLKAQKKFKPEIEKAVIAARKEAENKGDVFNELSQAKAALPGLTNAVDQLRELSKVATSTFGGRVFDLAVKETGFGATEGATAKAKFIAIVNNQVLPLLKPTFGAAFTVQEGESLKKTMGDPDASPAEKMVQLDAFIDQKLRDIETKESQLNPEAQTTTPQSGVIRFDRTGKRIQ